jgi:membrane-associated phospholipid phosphatase
VAAGDAGGRFAARAAQDGNRLAGRLADAAGPARQWLAAGLYQAGQVDRAVYAAIASVDTPALDRAVRRLSRAADKSRLWLGTAAVLAIAGGPAGRRAAAHGLIAVGVTSALVNVGMKSVYTRRRPDRTGAGVPGRRQVTMPLSASFPSGHSASAFAFASAVGRDLPWLALGLHLLAGGVAYSRVHTGVHYPGDTIIGAIIGESTAQAVSGLMDRHVPALRVRP